MTLDQIRSELAHYRGYFPEDALREAIARPAEVTPFLLAALEEAAADPASLLERHPETYFLYLYAFYLLAQFRETRAYPLMLRFCAGAPEAVEDLAGDVVTEDLHNLLASVCDGDIEPLKALVAYEEADEFVRSAALHALITLMLEGALPRHVLTAYLGGLLRTLPEHETPLMAALLVNAVYTLHAPELLPEVEALYAAGRVDSNVIGLDEVRQTLALEEPDTLGRLRDEGYGYVEDALELLAVWACFNTGGQNAAAEVPQQPYVREMPKVGRNDPCPCGSGKKYKKCHGA
ncbi:MAG TPA: DUF1186 domain-containing protein [Candidatus Competibacteraceae bacterium]|nr:DUF1186 domain-containing protein [Candidatus Competibacteraceae bacterium]